MSSSEKSELLSKMCHYIPHARYQGIHLVSVNHEEVELCLPYRDELVGNPDNGAVHGGALTVLLDHTLGIASITHDEVGACITPTLDLRIDHLGVVASGRDIFAAAKTYRVTRRIAFVEGLAWGDRGPTAGP
ncbi:hotdog fold thioesterase [Seongchinamella sediminis]|uniref:Hotdog fold thioesterase n=1 Tax=Seongchinamella sediminis TaxID=2283635 RepID=A0A3L7DZE3_9GAMM|nr:hotdog fold thioesterase [Seongchinamella sediminis]